ncbi:MAG: DUF3379 family protein [Wenzhouxiangellaceae bacterium]|nr:DUF3379 family protein [Wenzhouxiangellaceae bacterium]
MNLLEFKRRLMTDPANREPEMLEARAAGGEYAGVAAESDRFELMLGRALHVPAPHGLADEIILRQSLAEDDPSSGRFGRWPYLAAVAAALALAVAVTTFTGGERSQPTLSDLRQHIAWHWQHDGPQVIAAANAQASDIGRIEQVFAELGLHIEPGLLDTVRLTKFCPTPDGAGAHAVLETESGTVTMYYMPRTHVPSAPARIRLDDGMESLVVNVERGSLALIAPAGVDMPELAREIERQLSFAPVMTI